jgi:ferrochelatase
LTSALDTVPVARRATTQVIFSAHSLPEKILASGDTYPDQLRESARRAAEIARVRHWDIAWQSAGRTADPWIGPDILQVIRTKKAEGVTDIVSCPIGFVSDHLEVLYDIDVEAQAVAREVGDQSRSDGVAQ